MSAKIYNVLVLCTGNSCRSVLGEALVNHLGAGRFKAWSAGSKPLGRINPGALATLARHGLPTTGYTSKSWAALEDVPFDILIAVCDSAAGEACPVYLSSAVRANWGVADPGHVEGSPDVVEAAFEATFATLKQRIARLVELPIDTMSRAELSAALEHIGRDCP